MNVEVLISAHPSLEERNELLTLLATYNVEHAGLSGYEEVAILLRDSETGIILGGLWGSVLYEWLSIELLFVPAQIRGRGFGSKLLQMAEESARDRECVGIWLSTFSFQAPEFYRRHGYTVFGTIDHHPRGSQRIFFRRVFERPRQGPHLEFLCKFLRKRQPVPKD